MAANRSRNQQPWAITELEFAVSQRHPWKPFSCWKFHRRKYAAHVFRLIYVSHNLTDSSSCYNGGENSLLNWSGSFLQGNENNITYDFPPTIKSTAQRTANARLCFHLHNCPGQNTEWGFKMIVLASNTNHCRLTVIVYTGKLQIHLSHSAIWTFRAPWNLRKHDLPHSFIKYTKISLINAVTLLRIDSRGSKFRWHLRELTATAS